MKTKGLKIKAPRKVFEYQNYRELLRDFYATSKARDKKFTYRFLSKLAGFQTPSFLKHVIDGEKNLSQESAGKLAEAFNLNKMESHFFRTLVLLNQATTVEEKQKHLKELLSNRAYRSIYPLKESQYHYFSKWYYIAVRELILLPGFREDPKWIAEKIRPQISAEQVREALTELMNLGLLKRNPTGKLELTDEKVATPDELTNVSLAECHREFMKRASESIDTVPREKRDISGVTFRLSEQSAKKIKELIQNFRRELVTEASKEQAPSSVYQLNLQLFPLAEVEEEENE